MRIQNRINSSTPKSTNNSLVCVLYCCSQSLNRQGFLRIFYNNASLRELLTRRTIRYSSRCCCAITFWLLRKLWSLKISNCKSLLFKPTTLRRVSNNLPNSRKLTKKSLSDWKYRRLLHCPWPCKKRLNSKNKNNWKKQLG